MDRMHPLYRTLRKPNLSYWGITSPSVFPAMCQHSIIEQAKAGSMCILTCSSFMIICHTIHISTITSSKKWHSRCWHFFQFCVIICSHGAWMDTEVEGNCTSGILPSQWNEEAAGTSWLWLVHISDIIGPDGHHHGLFFPMWQVSLPQNIESSVHLHTF